MIPPSAINFPKEIAIIYSIFWTLGHSWFLYSIYSLFSIIFSYCYYYYYCYDCFVNNMDLIFISRVVLITCIVLLFVFYYLDCNNNCCCRGLIAFNSMQFTIVLQIINNTNRVVIVNKHKRNGKKTTGSNSSINCQHKLW